MVGRRKVASRLPPRLYESKGKRGSSYFTITPANKYVGLGRDLVEAKKKLAAIEGETFAAGTIGDLIDDAIKLAKLQVEQGKRSARYPADCEAYSVPLKQAFGRMNPAALRPAHVWTYLHKARGVEAPIRANKEVGFLQVVLGRACSQGMIDRNPCVGVERNEETPRDRLVSDVELLRFCKTAARKSDYARRIALAAAIAYLTGKAQGQILGLKRSQIGRDGITFGKRKGGANTFVAWSKRLRRYVEASIAMPSAVESMFVVHTTTGGPYTAGGFKKGWQTLMSEWVAMGGERFTFHDLRAKAITDTIEQGRKASELTGHRQEATVSKIYDRRATRKSAAVR